MDNRFLVVDVSSVPENIQYQKTLEFYNETVYGKAGIPMNWKKTKKYIRSASENGFCKGLIDANGFNVVGAIIVLKSKNMFSDADALVDLCVFMAKEYRTVPEAKKAFEELFREFMVWAKENAIMPTITNTAGITDGGFFKKMGMKEVGSVYKII